MFGILILLLVIIYFNGLYNNSFTMQTGKKIIQNETNTSSYREHTQKIKLIHGVLMVYKNNKLVYYNNNDPPTSDLEDMFKNIIFYSASDTTHGYYDLKEMYVGLVNSNIAYQYSMGWNTISSSTTLVSVDEKDYTDNGTPVIYFYAKYYFSSSTTLYAISLVGYYLLDNTEAEYSYHYKLLFYDYLPSSLSLNGGDTLVVVYKVSFPELGG